MLWTGTFERKIDDKGRIQLPKLLKQHLKRVEVPMFLCPGTNGCIELHDQQSLTELKRKIESSVAGNATSKTFQRLFFSQAETCMADSQGRIRLSEKLSEWAGLKQEVVLVGLGDYWEIWDENTWSEYVVAEQLAFDSYADRVLTNNPMEDASPIDVTKTAAALPNSETTSPLNKKAR